MRFLILFLNIFFSFSLSAQTTLNLNTLITSDVATRNDAWALYINPAGLVSDEGVSFSGGYAHAWLPQGRFHEAKGAFSVSVLEIFGFGAGFNLVIPYDKNNLNIADNPLSNKGFLTGTFGAGFSIDDFFKFGATAAFSKILESKEEVPIAFATGLQFLPFDWFSLGAFGKMANAQFLEPWQFNIGATFRPAKKYLDLSFNAKFFPKSLNWLDGFSYHPGAMIGVNIEKFSIRFNVEVMDIESGFDKLNFMLGFAYMFDHAGLETIGGMSTDGYLTTTGQFYLHTGEEQGTKSAENNEDIL